MSEKPPAPPEPVYPCVRCGKTRTAEEGGDTFTVCDDCWEATKMTPPAPVCSTCGISGGHKYGCAATNYHIPVTQEEIDRTPPAPETSVTAFWLRKIIDDATAAKDAELIACRGAKAAWKARADKAEADNARLRAALFHERWCATCGEDGCSSCSDCTIIEALEGKP